MKRIVFINRSFYPDVEATGQFYTELAEFLSGKFDITFVCGLSYYVKIHGFGFKLWRKEKFKNVKIIRVRHTLFWKGNILKRFINWLTFSFVSFFVLLKIKPHIVICGTDPPLLGILCYILKKLKNVPFIYGCNDLYPDVAIALGTFKKGFLTSYFDYLNKKALVNSLKIIALGEDMKELIVDKGIKKTKVCVIPSWVDTRKIFPVPEDNNLFLKKYNLKGKFVIMYSGNIGLPHNLEVLVDALEKVRSKEDWVMVFVGDGVKRKEILQRIKYKNLENRVKFLPYQPKDFLSHSLSAADLHIVSLKDGAKGVCVPSKIYGILSAGKAFISICDKDSNSSVIVKKYRCGLYANPGDVDDIKNKIEWAITNKQELKKMEERARKTAIENFDKDIVLKKWEEFMGAVSID